MIIVGRGGGSIEDLWAFNEEIVAQEVFDCNVPIISAVGHETDTTIIDYVADMRAPTPSAAAELAVYDVNLLLGQMEGIRISLYRQMQSRIKLARMKQQTLETKLKMNSPMGRIREKRTYSISLEERLSLAMKNRILKDRHRMAIYIEKLKGLSPLDKLNQGYSYVADASGRTVTDVHKVAAGDQIQIYVKNGRIGAEVKEKYLIKKMEGE